MATALPSVNFFDSGGETSAVAVLGDGIAARAGHKPAVIYAAENHNHAAEILTEKLAGYLNVSEPPGKKGSGSFCRNGPEGASHKLDLSPLKPLCPFFSPANSFDLHNALRLTPSLPCKYCSKCNQQCP
jgi:hypothetical protein